MRNKIFGATFGLALAISATGLFLTECSSDNNPGTGDGGASSCPANPPTPGTACSLPNGTMCNQYAQPGCECCGASAYACVDGKWQETGMAAGAQPSTACPTTVPEAGSFCYSNPCTGGAEQACTYDCTTGDGEQSIATCNGSSWSVQANPAAGQCLADGGADAGDDAGDGG